MSTQGHHLYKFVLIGQAVTEKKMFEYNNQIGYIHVYSPGVGADNPLEYFFSHINDLVTVFPHSNI